MGVTRYLVVTLATLALVACSARQPILDQRQGQVPDRKLSTWAFIDEGQLTTFIVDTYATRWRTDEPYIPIEVVVANNGMRQLRLTRESFILIDADGNRYPAASPEELIEHYKFLDLDRERMMELPTIVHNKFAAYTRYGSKFSPTTTTMQKPVLSDDLNEVYTGNSGLVRDLISLPKFGYMNDLLYFPQPTGGVKDRYFELFMSSPDLPDPVFVKFEVK